MHGCGNDFIVVPRPWEVASATVRALCDRRTGIGADGILVVGERADGAWPVIVHNADGTIAAACGNGYRCVARLLFEREGVDEVVLATPGGPVRAWRDGDEYAIELPAPVVGGALRVPNGNGGIEARLVRAGNPNVVVYVDDPTTVALADLARSSTALAGPANVAAVAVRSRSALTIRVHERGAGETLACGTGSCAAVALGVADGRLDVGTVAVSLPGGTLRVTPGRDRYVLAGPAAVVFTGVIP